MPYYCHFGSDGRKIFFDSHWPNPDDSNVITLLKGVLLNDPLVLPLDEPEVPPFDSLPDIRSAVIKHSTPQMSRRDPESQEKRMQHIRVVMLGEYRPVLRKEWPAHRDYTDIMTAIEDKFDPQKYDQQEKIDVLRLKNPSLFSTDQPKEVKDRLAGYAPGQYFGTSVRFKDSLQIAFYYTSNNLIRTTVTTGFANAQPSLGKFLCYLRV